MNPPIPKSRKALRDKLIEAAIAKFESISPGTYQSFWEIVISDIEYHAQGNSGNKNNHFNENRQVIGITALVTSGEKHGALLARAVQCAGLLLLSFLVSWFGSNRLVSMVVSLLVLILLSGSLYLTYNAQAKRMQLALRQYGETWVRHSAALFEYEQELLRFVYDLDPYDAVPPQLQPKRFQTQILQIRARNQARFESNMSGLAACVEQPPENT
ncbi:MAG: hypothetical protein HFH27_08660 [Clostridiaceae bacterium]|nr:hypothetical protein [Clostridiaceae bacterium]